MSKLKVLHLIDSGGFFGAEQMLLDLISAQRALGLDAVLGSIAEPKHAPKAIEEKAEALGLPWARFDMVNKPSFASCNCLVDYANKHGFQLVHTHGYKAAILLAMKPKVMRGFPVIATVHGYTSRTLNKMYIYELVDRVARCLLQASIFVAGSYQVKRTLFGIKAVIPNGLGPALANWQADDDLCSYLKQYKVIGSVGRFSPEKGFDILISAFAKVQVEQNDLRLLLIGDGGFRSQYEQQIKALGLEDKVWLAGYRDNAAGYIPYFDLFVNSSHTEGLPITLLEAMRGNTPIVASAVGGIPTLLNQGEFGELVESGSESALVSGIKKGLSDTALHKANLAVVEFDKVYKREVMANRYIELYKQILS